MVDLPCDVGQRQEALSDLLRCSEMRVQDPDPHALAEPRRGPAQALARSPGLPRGSWWRRLQPIRTAAAVPLAFAVFTREPFVCQQIGPDVWKMRKLGMTLQAIGNELGVHEKTVRNILGQRPTR